MEILSGSRSKGGDHIEWQMYCVPLLTAVLMRVKANEEPKYTVYEALRMIVENDAESMDVIFDDVENDWELAAREQYLFFKH